MTSFPEYEDESGASTILRLLAAVAVAAAAVGAGIWASAPGKVRLVSVALCAEDDANPGDSACRHAVCVLRGVAPEGDQIPDLRGEARILPEGDLGEFNDPNPEGPRVQCWRPRDAPAPVKTALRNAYQSVCRNTVDAGLCRVPGGDGGALVPAPYETTLPRSSAVGLGCVPMPSGCPKEQTDIEGLNSCFPAECRVP